MGNDNIRKEIEKIKQVINKEVRGKGKWIGDKYVYTPLHKENFFLRVIVPPLIYVYFVGGSIIGIGAFWIFGGLVFCLCGDLLGFDMDWFCETEFGFIYKPIQIIMNIFFGYDYKIL